MKKHLLFLIALMFAGASVWAQTTITVGISGDHTTIQAAVNAATAGDIIEVAAGTYNEDVVINKKLSLSGAGYDVTTVLGPIGGNGATMKVAAAGVLIDGFGISRVGNNTTDWNNAGLNSAGIAIQSQGNYAEVKNCHLYGNRTGIDVNNSNGNNIHNNLIDNNRTGLIFRNQTDNTIFTNNFVTNNWTAGILFLDASNGSNSPIQTAANSTFNNNDISGNWYGDIVDRQAGGSLPAPGSNMKNFECNWYDNTSPLVSTDNSAEPGYAAQIPVLYGGTAVAPGGQPNIMGPGSANIDYVTYLLNGTDDDPVISGFQPMSGACSGAPVIVYEGTSANIRSGHLKIQDAINAATAGDVILVSAGTYPESDILINKDLTLKGANADKSGADIGRTDESIIEGAVRVEANNVTVQGFYIDGTHVDQTPALRKRGVLVANTSARANVSIKNNIIKDWVTGISMAGGYTFPWVDGATIDGNLLINNSIGSTENVNNLTISNNSFDNTGFGIGGGAILAATPIGNTFSGLVNGRYISAASGVTADFSAMFAANTFDKAVYVAQASGSWYDRAIFSAIQPAIDVAVVESVIEVAPGTYSQALININKKITLNGANYNIDPTNAANGRNAGSNSGESVIVGPVLINASDVSLHGFYLDYNGALVMGEAISVYLSNGVANISLKNNILEDSDYDINNTIPWGTHKGIITSSAGSSNVSIISNLFAGYESAAYLNPAASNVLLDGNKVLDCKYGFRCVSTQGLTITNNYFDGSGGLQLRAGWGAGAPSISGLTIDGNSFNNLVAGYEWIGFIDNQDVNLQINLEGKSNTFDAVDMDAMTYPEDYFVLENYIVHAMDNATKGMVVTKADHLFVNPAPQTLGIQRALNLASSGWTVNVSEGTFNENVLIEKPITLLGANANTPYGDVNRGGESKLLPLNSGQTTIRLAGAGTSDNVTINGFEISGDMSNYGIYCGVNGPSNLNIKFNYIHDIGVLRGSGNIYAIAYHVHTDVINTTDVNVTDNYITNVANTTIAAKNSAGIWFGQSNGNGTVSNVTIQNNTIEKVYSAKSYQEASGIYIGVAWGAGTGSVASPLIKDNTIKDIVGYIAYGIQLSGKTPGAQISNNAIDNISGLAANPLLATGVAVPITNTGSATVLINNNSLTNVPYAVFNGTVNTIDASLNYFGGCPSTDGDVNFYPYYTTVSGSPGSFVFGGLINNIEATASSATSCAGQPVTIQASNGSNYEWFKDDVSIGSGVTVSVSPGTEGVHAYTLKGNDANGCGLTSTTVELTVNAALDAQVDVVAVNNVFTLTASGGTSYLWSTGATTAGITVYPTSSATYTVSVSNGSCSASVSVNVSPIVVDAGPNQTIPSGNTAQLSASVQGIENPTYAWTPAGKLTNAAIANPVTVGLTETTVFTLTVNGVSDDVTISVAPALIADAGADQTINPGESVQLIGSATGGTPGYTYNWMPGNLSGATVSVNPATTTTYTLTVTDALGLTDDDEVTVTTVAGGYTVSGNIAYAFGTGNAQMHEVEVKLVGVNTYTTTTAVSGNGDYSIPGVLDGTYTVQLNSPKPWNGVSSADITAIAAHYRASRPSLLHGIKRLAADVYDNSTGITVNGDDRTAINNRISLPSSSFTTGDWVFTRAADIAKTTYPIAYANNSGTSTIEITVNGSNVTQDFRGLCYGDVNASNNGLKEIEITPEIYDVTNDDLFALNIYPNPFKGQTTINFYQAVAGKISIQLFDMMGNRVKYIEEAAMGEGEHYITLDGSQLTPGIYLYVMMVKTNDDILLQRSRIVVTR